MTKTIDKYAPTMSSVPKGHGDRLCLTKADEISHIAYFLDKLTIENLVPELTSELDSAITFCLRALATPGIKDVTFEDEEYDRRFHNNFID